MSVFSLDADWNKKQRIIVNTYKELQGTSWWSMRLRLCTPGFNPGQGTRPCMPQIGIHML